MNKQLKLIKWQKRVTTCDKYAIIIHEGDTLDTAEQTGVWVRQWLNPTWT